MISVIVPIYNVENYLDECLDSIVNQTYKDIEILCIDDCTLDNSINIVKKYMRQDSRVRLINHKENRGLGGARNTGIQEACGEYITFVDSDDVLELSMLEKCEQAITAYNVDAVVCGIRRFCDGNELEQLSTFHYLKKPASRVFNISDHKERLVDMWPSAVNKMYKTSIIRQHKCRFPERLLYEDHYFYYGYFAHVDAFYYINECLYNYRASRPGSITSTITGRENEVFTILEQLEEMFKANFSAERWEDAYARVSFRLLWERSFLLWQDLQGWKFFCSEAKNWLLTRFDAKVLEDSVDSIINKSDAFYRYVFLNGYKKHAFRMKLALKGKPLIVKMHALYNRIKGYRTIRSYIKELVWVSWNNREKLDALQEMLKQSVDPSR